MLRSSEDACVLGARGWPKGNLHGDASRVSHLDASVRHRVACVVKREVHILEEERKEVRALEPSIDSLVPDDVLPDLSFFAACRLRQVLWSIELGHLGEGARLHGDL